MPQYFQNTIAIQTRMDYINSFPCFALLTSSQAEELSLMMQEIVFSKNEIITRENELIDSVYIIVNGQAEVTRETKRKRKLIQVPIAILDEGEAIGLNDTGFYSSSGKRTATVTAISDMLLLQLDIKNLYLFLQKNNLE
ncbi:MAG: hypothetical protein ACD_46C00081G0003, partial [uncultured bacterium]